MKSTPITVINHTMLFETIIAYKVVTNRPTTQCVGNLELDIMNKKKENNKLLTHKPLLS